MRNDLPSDPKRNAGPRRGLLSLLADSERGFTIIEVVVSALIVASVAGATATALIATGRLSGDQRSRSQADAIAQQDQERLRGMSIKALAGFTETRIVDDAGKPPATGYTGNRYTVHSTGRYLSSTGTSSCSTSGSGAAAYVLIRSEVNWQANMKTGADLSNVANWASNSIRPPISQEALVTPAAGGTLLTNVVDQDNQPLSGVTVSYFGPKETQEAVTGSEGCVIIGALSPTGYYVGAKRTGYVDPNGNEWPFGGATVSQTGTSFPTPNPFKLGEAGFITANFKTSFTVQGSGNPTGQKAPSISWQDNQSGMSASQDVIPGTVPAATISTPDKLFPFNNGTPGVYTNNYAVWAGSCDTARPPSGVNLSNVTVGPNGVATLNDGAAPNFPRMRLPALIINVHYRPNAATPYAPVTPAHIKFTDACGPSSQSWFADVRSGSTYPKTGGELAFPGQPYAPNVSGQMLQVCVDYGNGGNARKKTVSTSNTNFTNGTLVPTIQIDGATTNPNEQGAC